MKILFQKDGEVIEFLGEQDVKGYGFFRHVDKPTFFGMKLCDMEKNGWVQIAK